MKAKVEIFKSCSIKQKNPFQKDFGKRSNFGPSKIHNYHLANVIKKKIKFYFIISLFKTNLITVNNLIEI
jgi:hypothetical protein